MNEDKKYLIYKQSGGLSHMLYQINNAIHLSKISKRSLIIDCDLGAFKNDFNKYFNIPNFSYVTNYDSLYRDDSIDHILFEPYIKAEAKCVNSDDFLNNTLLIRINSNETIQSTKKIIFCSWIDGFNTFSDEMLWYIKVNKNIVDEISANKISEKYIGIHYRNTDMKHELETFISEIFKLSDQINVIYLGTDDYTASDRLNKLIGDKFRIIQYTKPYDNQGRNIHYGNPNKDEVIMNSLIDTYHLAHSTYFIPSVNSSFSKRIVQLRKNDTFFQ